LDASVIDRYSAGGELLRNAVVGLSEADLLAHPIPNTWSIKEIVVHLMDSDLIGADRMKRIAAEPNPLLIGYDESAFARTLGYPQTDLQLALELFALNRQQTAAVLRQLPAESFERTGVHNEKGKVTLADMVRGYIDHLDGHLLHLHRKRELLGKPAK
jgi:hypothetical protein